MPTEIDTINAVSVVRCLQKGEMHMEFEEELRMLLKRMTIKQKEVLRDFLINWNGEAGELQLSVLRSLISEAQ